jgi:hypothetical protein
LLAGMKFGVTVTPMLFQPLVITATWAARTGLPAVV